MKSDAVYNNVVVNLKNEQGHIGIEEVINAVCADINDIYCLDIESQQVTIVRQRGKAVGLDSSKQTVDYNLLLNKYIDNNVFEKDREGLRTQLNINVVIRNMRNYESVSLFYRVHRNHEVNYFRAKYNRVGDAENFRYVVFSFLPEDFETVEAQVLHSIEKDDITGVYTKQAFFKHAAEVLDRNSVAEYDIVISDIKNFKMINRNFGRAGGDRLLKYLADSYVNNPDVVLCGRYGADQFVMLTYALSDNDINGLYAKAEKLRNGAPIPYTTVFYGINRSVDRADGIADMCDKALLAMRSNKISQENPISFYDTVVMQKHFRAQAIEDDFERALAEQEFVVWCQPKYNAFTKRMTSAEALVRWKHSEGNFISPGEFIPVFEADGLITKLDEYVFRYVCTRQKKLLDSGIEPLPISVNLSRVTLFSNGVIERYCSITDEIDLPKKYVPLELTESATVDNEQVAGMMDKLKSVGFLLHMDDFGSGYSSLASLASLHFDALKLDKTIIDGIGNNRGDELLRHIIQLAHFFQMEVVAEGVERDEQYRFLKKLSCDTIQGYLFSKPVPYDTYIEMSLAKQADEFGTVDSGILADEASLGSLRITNDLKMQYLSAVASIYMTMHVVDLKEDTVVEFATTTNVKEHTNRAHNAPAQMEATMRATVADEYIPAVLEFTDLNTIAERMKGKRTISAEFVGKHFGWFRARFIAVTTDEQDRPIKIIFTTQVIEADKRKEEVMIRACRTDELTGVYNKTALGEDLKMFDDPDNQSKENSRDLAVMSVDIRGLKGVNDVLGHAAGDELIWGTADCLNTVMGNGSYIYRVGGDNFIVIFYANQEKIRKICDDYDNEVSSWIGNEVRSLSTVYGIATKCEFPNKSVKELIEEADTVRLQKKKS